MTKRARSLTALSRLLTARYLARATVPLVKHFARKRPSNRIARTSAYYFGAAMSQRGEKRIGRLSTGAHIALNLEDYAHHHIYFFGVYETPTTKFLQRAVRPGWTVLDIGANAGYYSLLVHDLTGGRANIHAFEPNPIVANLLRRSVILNGANEITVVEAGCGSAQGVLPLYLSPDRTNTGRTTFLGTTFPEADAVHVPVMRVDEYCLERGLSPDLIKVDVEGFEHEAIDGMLGLLRAGSPRFLVCELAERSGRPSPAGLVERVTRFGFRAMDLAPNGDLEPLELRTDVLDVQNVVFQRNSVRLDQLAERLCTGSASDSLARSTLGRSRSSAR